MTALILVGAAGRMGRTVLECLEPPFTLAAAVVAPEDAERPLTAFAPSWRGSHTTLAALPSGMGKAVVLDFAAGPGLGLLASAAATQGYALVSGRTGLSAVDEKVLHEVSKRISVLHSRNLSVGANLLAALAAEAAARMPGAHLEIVETHHAKKADAPSGTALMILDALTQSRPGSSPVHGRQGAVGARRPQEIGIHAIRGGDVVGDHTVHLMVEGERLEITHRASDRRVFARGALAACRFVATQPPGFYTMADLLGY